MLKQSIVTDGITQLTSRNEDLWQLVTMVQQARHRNGEANFESLVAEKKPLNINGTSGKVRERLKDIRARRAEIAARLRVIENRRLRAFQALSQ